MAAKEVRFSSDARQRMFKGVNVLANAVKATLGPRGRNAVLEKSYGAPTSNQDRRQLAPGTQTYLEILWGQDWLVGTVGGGQSTFFVRTLPPALDQAYLNMLTDKGPPRAL